MNSEQREARRIYQAAWYQDHRENLLASQAAYDADHREARATYCAAHKDEARAYRSAYNATHREEARACHTAYEAAHGEERRAYHAAYRESHKDDIREKKAKEQAEFTEWLHILRTNNGCEDCGTHEGLLDFHHADPATKRYGVSQMVSYSLDALEDELEKCVVLCDPCHRTRHVEMRAA